MKTMFTETITLNKIVGGGQALGELKDGRKAFVWGGLPDETVSIETYRIKNRFVEAVVTAVEKPSKQRVAPLDEESYLSTSPWQIINLDAEQHYKAALVEEAFELHNIVLPGAIDMYTDNHEYGYRNKVEFSWWTDAETGQLDLAFFKRGIKGKIPVVGTSLALPQINTLALSIRDVLRTKSFETHALKSLLIRCNKNGDCLWQLYVKDKLPTCITTDEAKALPAAGGEIIYSDPKIPASRVSRRLTAFGAKKLQDEVLGATFSYNAESFFQVNLPVYEETLRDIKKWVSADEHVLDMYSGVGTIGLTGGGKNTTLVESDETAVSEMKQNIIALRSSAEAVYANSESALEYITQDATVILDPPRAGLHKRVTERLLDVKPKRIVYLSCDPVTQARDVAQLAQYYGIAFHRGYNYFPKTPHIEHLVVLELK